MKVLQILLLTIGLIISANILSRVSAQNSNANTASNRYSNNTANRYSGNYAGNISNTNNYIGNLSPTNQVLPLANTNSSSISEEEETPKILKLISQEQTVKFPKSGELQVQVIEEVGKPFTVRFVRDEQPGFVQDDEIIAQFVMRNPYGGYVREYWYSAVDPKVRFQIIKMEGIASPVIHLMMVQPGGSDYGFWSALFGEVNGKIKLLTPNTTQFSWEGGVQIGNLGNGNGTGVAVWNSIWDDGESHYGDHIYQVDFYNFNKKLGKFVKTKTVKTKQKHETPAKALESLGLGFYRDAVRDFPEFLEYRENF
jgi:hypothetical protein